MSLLLVLVYISAAVFHATVPVVTGCDYCVRLVNGPLTNEGIVEVSYGGVWGPVCYSRYVDRVAPVVCRQLGYTGGVMHPHTLDGYRRTQVLVERASCRGTEERLADCATFVLDLNASCGTSYVGVSCTTVRLANGDNRLEGFVEVIHNGVWGGVCGSGWDDLDAAVVCRELNYVGGVAWTADSDEARSTGWMDSVDCHGSEGGVSLCSHAGWHNYTCQTYAAVSCTMGLRLANGSNPWDGRVEVFHNAEWTTVCPGGHKWMAEDATVVCSELYYTGGTADIRADVGVGIAEARMGDVVCSRYFHYDRILDCPHTYYHCPPNSYAGVTCEAECADRDVNCLSCVNNRCARCRPGYLLSDDREHCIDCGTAIPHCRACGREQCRACERGYTVNSEGSQCIGWIESHTTDTADLQSKAACNVAINITSTSDPAIIVTTTTITTTITTTTRTTEPVTPASPTTTTTKDAPITTVTGNATETTITTSATTTTVTTYTLT